MNVDVEYNEKKRLNLILDLFRETTDMHVDVHYVMVRNHPRDKLDLSACRISGTRLYYLDILCIHREVSSIRRLRRTEN